MKVAESRDGGEIPEKFIVKRSVGSFNLLLVTCVLSLDYIGQDRYNLYTWKSY